MEQLRPVSKREKILFPIIVTIVVGLIVPDAIPLVGMLMLGNLFKESGVVDRISKTAQNELINIITIFLGVTVGATATAQTFLTAETLMIVVLGLIAFSISTAGGVLFGKLMYIFTGGKVNPINRQCGRIGSTDGGACVADGWSEGEPVELPAHACDGPERCGRYRQCGCGGRVPRNVRRLISCFGLKLLEGGREYGE